MDARSELVTRLWVAPYYMMFMNGRFLRAHNPPAAISAIQRGVEQISDEVIEELFHIRNWRHRLAGASFAGLAKRSQFTKQVGQLLLASELKYAGWGYCFALARFNTQESANYLSHYLDTFLLRYDDEYDQAWALGALLWLDTQQQTDQAQRYLLPQGLWEQFVHHRHDQERWKNILGIQQRFTEGMNTCQHRFAP